jgi:hypothetical protein
MTAAESYPDKFAVTGVFILGNISKYHGVAAV